MPSANSAHAFTNPRERLHDITATGVNVPTETFRFATITDAVIPSEARRVSEATELLPTNIHEQKLSAVLPPLVFGTATFNYQFNPDPYALHPNQIVAAALRSGIRAFDTSPYYGPAEEILGAALHSDLVTSDPVLSRLKREEYYILTKCGRIQGDEFDYTPEWIRHSVARSLRRLNTTYLDVVYLHDVEFVSAAEVLIGIRALRQLRNKTGCIRHVGICGFPVDVLCEMAEMIFRETGEPIDIVQSYGNFTVQNQRLLTDGLDRLMQAGVDVVPNASPLGMGLCRSQGVPVGNSEGSWHPAPDGLRTACLEAAKYVQSQHGEELETIAIRFAMENWLTAGAGMGSRGALPSEVIDQLAKEIEEDSLEVAGQVRPRLGVSVMGVSKLSELEDTMAVYGNVIAAQLDKSNARKRQVQDITSHIRENILGHEWTDHAWDSPDPGFVNTREVFGVSHVEREEFERVYGVEPESQSQKQDTSADKVGRVEVQEVAAVDV